MREYELAKYKNSYAIYSKTSRCYLVFGTKKRLLKRIKELNKGE